MKIEVGDRVIYNGPFYSLPSSLPINGINPGDKGVVLKIYNEYMPKAFIDFERVEMLCFISNLEIDKEWYREEKLKEIGI